MVDFPVPEGPIIPVFLQLISSVSPLSIGLFLSLGYEKKTSSNLKTPKKLAGMIALGKERILGYLSITFFIFRNASFPSPMALTEGKSCCKFSEGINRQNNIPKISPPEYRGEAGQSYDPFTHSLPYQNAIVNIPKKKKLAAN